MTSALSRLYCGPLEQLTPPLVSSTLPEDALPADQLLDANVIEERLERLAAQHQGNDIKAIASIWSQWHFAAVVVPALAANLLLERDLPVTLDEMAIQSDEHGCTRRLVLPHEGTPLPSLDAFQRFETLFQGHVSPLIEMLSCLSGASPRLFWSNFGNYFEYFANNAELHPMALPGVADEALRLVDHRVYPDGRRNPLFMPVRYLENETGERHRTRRLCCLRYRLDDCEYCGNCPLEATASTRAAKRAAVVQKFAPRREAPTNSTTDETCLAASGN
ncbi:transporter [Halomonas cupida]|uniref:Ferric iron reductase protein FhuF n=1 Tax=Halomonas cupida TaxID=44933 RepID=A0A1M7CU26_9GAMM|nr:siderophore-iron reductase FhuF [Halomonas cupida]GEN25885.1 transporter [Halomonas cupida]SHL70838.1 ferric iron reductase protein FhuF [Halomonas cupida]